jgi:hypothetical protein
MAQRLGLPPSEDHDEDPVNNLVCRYEATGGHADHLYPRVRSVLRDQFPTPEPLRQLARIPHFRTYVTTTFDSLLEQALNQEPGAKAAMSLAYSLARPDDLPSEAAACSCPIVYDLSNRAANHGQACREAVRTWCDGMRTGPGWMIGSELDRGLWDSANDAAEGRATGGGNTV